MPSKPSRPESEEYLASPGAGGGTVRVADTVRRSPDRVSPVMLSVLRHLERVGFDAAPRVIGRDADRRWILTYVPGQVALPPYPPWTVGDRLLASVAALLRRYHDAVRDVALDPGRVWSHRPPREYGGSTICHLDVSMANVVCHGEEAVALIDFEEAAPADPIWDVARTVRHWVPLLDPVDLQDGLRELADRQAERLALFAAGYGLTAVDRSRLVNAVLANADASYRRMRVGAIRGHPGYLREWSGFPALRNRRARAWVERHRRRLELTLVTGSA